MHPWHDLAPGLNPPESVTMMVEIPRGSRNKYELDKPSGLLRLDRVLYSAVHYPADYGLIPRTLAEDGDPCDGLVLLKEPTFPGCLIDVRPIGLLRMQDHGEPDNKILAGPVGHPNQEEYFDVADLPGHFRREVEHFFSVYKDLEGKEVSVRGWGKCEEAFREVESALERYRREYGDAST
jgi:inorganic pyrophosphatase